jgi:hypothetical protein
MRFAIHTSGHIELIDDPMYARHVLTQGHGQLTLMKAGHAASQGDGIAHDRHFELAKACEMLRGQRLLDPVAKVSIRSVIDPWMFRNHGGAFQGANSASHHLWNAGPTREHKTCQGRPGLVDNLEKR